MIKTLRNFMASCIFVYGASAHAEIPTVSASATAGTPGGHVIFELAYDYGTGFEASLDEFKLRYDSRVLSFVAGNSTVERGGVEGSWLDYIGELNDLLQGSAGSFGAGVQIDPLFLPKHAYMLSFYTLGNVGQERSGIVRYHLWFDVSTEAEIGTTHVTVGGEMYDLQGQEFLYPDNFASPGIAVNVTAVPEPAQVLLLLAGLGIVAARYRRSKTTYCACA